MKPVHLLLIGLASLAYAGEDGNDGLHAPVCPIDTGTDGISITVIDTWTPGVQILGLDWLNSEDGYVIMASAEDDRINRWDAAGGCMAGGIDLMDTNTNCFGVAAGPEGAILTTNDWMLSNLFVNSGGVWVDLPENPAVSLGRGMEFDEATGEYWEAATANGVYSIYNFVPGGTTNRFIISEPSYQLSGLAVFPCNGNLGVVVTSYNVHQFYFYEYDGSTLTHFGTVPCPSMGQAQSYGLCYADSRGTFFWSWAKGSACYLSELDIDFDAGLTPDTWGGIKAQF